MAEVSIRIQVPASPTVGRADALVVPLTPADSRLDASTATRLGRSVATALRRLTVLPAVGSIDQALLDATASPRLAVVSLGSPDKADPEAARRAGAAVGKWAASLSLRRLAVAVDPLVDRISPSAIQAWCEGILLGDFRFSLHRRSDAVKRSRCTVDLLSWRAETRRRAATDAGTATKIAEAVNLARELAHEPANVINPVTLAARVRRLATASGLKCQVLDEKQLRKRKMGAILAVGQGSASAPRLIVLEHKGSGRGRPVVLVGKAITFDTGGYSLKPPDSMVGMKYDKCGAMAVIGALHAAAALKLKTPVIGVIAAAENMVSARAYRPNDIIRAMSGTTIEIISTDAEGRLVLADALTYAQREYKPRAMIDLATLTGGARVALGTVCAAAMGNDEALTSALIAAGQRTHERLWPLPLWDDYRELLKSEDADIKNSGGRAASTISGGMFLKEFVDDSVPWAHLDIAAVADIDKDGPYCPKGATGFGVRLLVDYLQNG